MVSDQEIASCVESLLRQSGPNAIASVNGVVRELEAKLGLDLSHKASFIRDQIELLVGPPKDRFALQTHHQFHLHPHPQAHPFHQPHRQYQPLSPASSSASSSSPFTHLLHHQELSFRYPPQPLPASAAAEQEFRQQQHEQLQQQQHPPPPLPAPTAPQHAATSQKESALAGVKRRGGPGGLSKVCGVSPQLQAIVGEPTMARTQIVKQLWAYIRKNNLQDPNNKRKIICNDELRMVFETDCTDMFKMNKLLAKHIIPLESTSPSSKRLKATATEVVSATEPDADQYPVVISDALANFFGTGEREMLQSEALRRVWDYIKNNQLEDPMNTMMILCDSKLQQLFECESLSALGISEMLSRHLFKQS